MSSNTSPSTDIRGILAGIQHMGYTTVDGIRELIDNELDACATVVNIIIQNKCVVVAGNGKGMNKASCARAVTFFAAKEASSSAGRFGLGENAAHLVLSGAKEPTYIFTRQADSEKTIELEANWPEAIVEGKWSPYAGRITADNSTMWEKYAINRVGQGTVKLIPMQSEKYEALKENRDELLQEIGFAYEKQINNGKRLRIQIEGVNYDPDMSLALNYESTPPVRRGETSLELWKNGDEERVYYMHTSLKPAFTDMVRQITGSENKIRDYATAEEQGFRRIAKFTLRSMYTPESNPPFEDGERRGEVVPGYIALERDDRVLCRIPGMFPGTSGDYEERRVVGATRHSLSFTYAEDELIGVEVNKSHVREQSVNKVLLETIHMLGRRWSKTYYKSIKVNPDVAPEQRQLALRIKRACATLKRMANENPDFLDAFTELTDEFNNDEEDESV
jgi:hypothetical protein